MRYPFLFLALVTVLFFGFQLVGINAEDLVWEGFEGTLDDWVSATWENVGQVELSFDSENVSEGKRSLKVIMKEEAIDWKNKVVFSKEDYINLAEADMVMDVFSPASTGIAVAVGFDAGSDWAYYESIQKTMKGGWNKDVTFDLGATKFKCRASDWKYTQPLADREDIRRVHILVYRPSKMTEQIVYIDNIRFK